MMSSLAASLRWLSSAAEIIIARAYLVDECSLKAILDQACENTGFIQDGYHRVSYLEFPPLIPLP